MVQTTTTSSSSSSSSTRYYYYYYYDYCHSDASHPRSDTDGALCPGATVAAVVPSRSVQPPRRRCSSESQTSVMDGCIVQLISLSLSLEQGPVSTSTVMVKRSFKGPKNNNNNSRCGDSISLSLYYYRSTVVMHTVVTRPLLTLLTSLSGLIFYIFDDGKTIPPPTQSKNKKRTTHTKRSILGS